MASALDARSGVATSGGFDPYEYFPGNTRAWGIVQNWRGRIVRRFEVDIAGRIDGRVLILDERFHYADGERATRTWRIERDGGDRLRGTAEDIVGTATGELRPNAMRWRYTMDVAAGRRCYRLSFDDWMWPVDPYVLVNRSTLRKFGIRVAEVTIFMQRTPD